jgi:DNA-directed RNA polymerase specialized sigma24 family protein
VRVLATTASDSQPDFQHELLAIREDPEVRSLALRRAKNPEVAEDALQSAYCAVLQVTNPSAIEDLRAYYCRVLINQVYREFGQLRAVVLEDLASLADKQQGQAGRGSPLPQPFSDQVATRLLGQGWLAAFTARRWELAAGVPHRSPDAARYQRLIVKVAEHTLKTILRENADVDVNAVLRAGYPEWFAAQSSSENTRHQRLARARADVCALLQTIIERSDLIS